MLAHLIWEQGLLVISLLSPSLYYYDQQILAYIFLRVESKLDSGLKLGLLTKDIQIVRPYLFEYCLMCVLDLRKQRLRWSF